MSSPPKAASAARVPKFLMIFKNNKSITRSAGMYSSVVVVSSPLLNRKINLKNLIAAFYLRVLFIKIYYIMPLLSFVIMALSARVSLFFFFFSVVGEGDRARARVNSLSRSPPP